MFLFWVILLNHKKGAECGTMCVPWRVLGTFFYARATHATLLPRLPASAHDAAAASIDVSLSKVFLGPAVGTIMRMHTGRRQFSQKRCETLYRANPRTLLNYS